MREDILEVVTITFFTLGMLAFIWALLGIALLSPGAEEGMFFMGIFHSLVGVLFLCVMKGGE